MSILESKQTILQPEVAAIHYTLLLVDMSGSVVDSGDMPALIQAASSFGDRVGPYQKVAVYTFDGSPHITPVVGFGGNVRAGINALATRRPRDPSTNLNGAVIEAFGVLLRTRWSTPRCRCASGRWWSSPTAPTAPTAPAPEDVDRALDGAGFETYVIGVGQEVDRGQLSKIGRSGTFASQNRADVQKGFDEIGARIEASSKRYYLLSYCSPSRAGEHQVEIEAVAHGTSGRLVLPLQRQRLWSHLRSQPAAGLRRAPPAPDAAQRTVASASPRPAPSPGGTAPRPAPAPQWHPSDAGLPNRRANGRARRRAWPRRTPPRRSRSG